MASKTATLPRLPVPARPMSQRPRALAGWLAERGELVHAPITLTRVPGGRTNRTWMITDSSGRGWVLRERGQVDTRSLGREVSVMNALADLGLPVPRVVGYGGSRSAARFMVSDFAPGFALHTEGDARALSTPQRHACGAKIVEMLGRIHATDPVAVGLPQFKTGHLDRQLARLTDLWTVTGTSGLHDSAWRAVRARLIDRRPAHEPKMRLVHGDYRLGNLIVCAGEVSAVLDWERCTVGNPLTDLAWLLNSWRGPGDPCGYATAATRAGGFSSRQELVRAYRNVVDVSLVDLDYYRALAYWVAATLIQAERICSRISAATGDQPAPDWDALIADELLAASERLRSYS